MLVEIEANFREREYMSKRTASSRNLLGGFLGGVMGILASAFFTPQLLWVGVGCFVGVSIGYWYGELWSIVTEMFSDIWAGITWFFRKPKPAPKKRITVFSRVGNWFAKKTRVVKSNFAFLQNADLTLWMKRHPVHAMQILSRISSIICLVLLVGYAYYAMIYSWSVSSNGALWWKGITIGSILLFSLHGFVSIKAAKKKHIRENFQAIQRRGLFFYSVHKLASFIVAGIMTPIGVAFLIVALLAWLAIGWILFAVLFLPLKLVWFSLTRTNHLPCFVVTLLTTVAAVLLFQPNIHEALRLWTLSLTTGVACGLLSEAVRAFFMWSRKKSPAIDQIAKMNHGSYYEVLCETGNKLLGLLDKPFDFAFGWVLP